MAGSLVVHRVKPRQADECPADGVGFQDCLLRRQRLLVAGPGAVVIGAGQGDVAQAADAVGLAEHVPHLLVQRPADPGCASLATPTIADRFPIQRHKAAAPTLATRISGSYAPMAGIETHMSCAGGLPSPGRK